MHHHAHPHFGHPRKSGRSEGGQRRPGAGSPHRHPGGQDFGGFGRGRGPGFGRGRGGGGRPGGRGRRGDVRAAILALLAERPMHGYEMLQELSERTHDLWRPSPGSLYPALQLLEDQGLVRSVTEDGRRRFELTDEGRAAQAQGPGPAPWDAMIRDADRGDMALQRSLRALYLAVAQVAEAGSEAQKSRVEELLGEVRRQVYLLLAEPTADAGPVPGSGDAGVSTEAADDGTPADA